MSDPTDIKALDEYLKGDSDVSQRYRELGRDEVPPELDSRVLAEARAAVADEGTKRSRSWLRWSAPVALAASVVLVVTVVLERGVQDETVLLPQSAANVQQVRSEAARDDKANEAAQAKMAAEVRGQRGFVPVVPVEPTLAMDAPVPPPPKPAVVDVRQFRELAAPPEVKVEQQAGQAAAVPEAPAVAPPAQAPEPMAARKSAERSEAEADSSADVQEEAAVSGSRTRRATGRNAGPRDTISRSSSSLAGASRPATEESAERSDPQAWLEDIRDMRRAGKTAEADREWERFREAFPDFHVEDDDIARKQP